MKNFPSLVNKAMHGWVLSWSSYLFCVIRLFFFFHCSKDNKSNRFLHVSVIHNTVFFSCPMRYTKQNDIFPNKLMYMKFWIIVVSLLFVFSDKRFFFHDQMWNTGSNSWQIFIYVEHLFWIFAKILQLLVDWHQIFSQFQSWLTSLLKANC